MLVCGGWRNCRLTQYSLIITERLQDSQMVFGRSEQEARVTWLETDHGKSGLEALWTLARKAITAKC